MAAILQMNYQVEIAKIPYCVVIVVRMRFLTVF